MWCEDEFGRWNAAAGRVFPSDPQAQRCEASSPPTGFPPIPQVPEACGYLMTDRFGVFCRRPTAVSRWLSVVGYSAVRNQPAAAPAGRNKKQVVASILIHGVSRCGYLRPPCALKINASRMLSSPLPGRIHGTETAWDQKSPAGCSVPAVGKGSGPK